MDDNEPINITKNSGPSENTTFREDASKVTTKPTEVKRGGIQFEPSSSDEENEKIVQEKKKNIQPEKVVTENIEKKKDNLPKRKVKAVIYYSEDEEDFMVCASSCSEDDDNNEHSKHCKNHPHLGQKDKESVFETDISGVPLVPLRYIKRSEADKFIENLYPKGPNYPEITQINRNNVELEVFDDHEFQKEHQLDEYLQSVARAAFGDMVADIERNHLYNLAIQKSVKHLKSKGEEVHGLDIGCGTGLLSMMAVRAGADRVTACDSFEPIASCAKKIVAANGMDDCIVINAKWSNDLTLPGEEQKPNLLVAELLDSELIGEGCLYSYRDAVKRLTAPGALFVPTRARVYVQLVQSEDLFRFHHFRRFYQVNGSDRVFVPIPAYDCFGSHILHDIQMNRLKVNEDFDIISDPVKVFDFVFNDLNGLKTRKAKRLKMKLKRGFNKPMMLFFWWDIDLDWEGEIVLSCAPYWARGMTSAKGLAWRDHWMQTIYYLPAFAFNPGTIEGFDPEAINTSRELLVDAFHDDFSFWFDLPRQDIPEPLDVQSEAWSCRCNLHVSFSRTRLHRMNDQKLFETYWAAFEEEIAKLDPKEKLNLVYLGDESFIPLLLASHPRVARLFLICSDRRDCIFGERLKFENPTVLEDKVKLCTHTSFHNYAMQTRIKIHGLLSECYFKQHNWNFPTLSYFDVLSRHDELLNHSKPSFVLPRKMLIRCMLVEFEELWKTESDIGCHVEGGFDLSEYDSLISLSRSIADQQISQQPLWEYESRALIKKPVTLFEFDCSNYEGYRENKTKSVVIDVSHLENKFARLKDPNNRWAETVGIVLWIDLDLGQDGAFGVSGGPTEYNANFEIDQEIVWVRNLQQGVAFLGKSWPVKHNQVLPFDFTVNLLHRTLSFSIP